MSQYKHELSLKCAQVHLGKTGPNYSTRSTPKIKGHQTGTPRPYLTPQYLEGDGYG